MARGVATHHTPAVKASVGERHSLLLSGDD